MTAPTSKRRFFDIAVNFTDGMFRGEYRGKQVHPDDREWVIKRSIETGVDKWMITGGNLQESKEALAICKEWKGKGVEMRCTVGCHPTRCGEFETGETTMEGLEEIIQEGLKEGLVAAVGECGLDYDRLEFCDKETQKKWFPKQLELAKKYNLPLFLHNRNTDGDFATVLEAHKDLLTKGSCAHSFTGTLPELHTLLSIDTVLFIGINGCSLRSSESAEVIKNLPFSRMLLETDAPWCDIRATHPGHGFVKTTFPVVKSEKKYSPGMTVKSRQEPCHMTQVFEVVCGYKEIEDENERDEAAKTIYENASKLYF
eukprot:TRINITY_DN3544_c0_g1_i1.p1 TRINITY_DN3544_c0_g1~~TRINITY_DN3544_c0_g1_i1.p1  ORF type:complete len:331 (+),score=92.73 TRINITY_DN3544_c0_g1_i1:57-995(+)